MKTFALATFASIAALGLAACSSEPEEEAVVVEDPVDPMAMNDMGPDTNVTLSSEQQTRYDAMDRQAASDEYDTNYESIMGDAGTAPLASGSMTETTPPSGSATPITGSSTNSAMTLPPRGEMDFAFLDRNDDGQLSVAEYAIWAVGVNPTEPKPNDQTRPYLRPEQINEAGQTFFYFDQDGNTYLSESEFQMARNSGRTA